MSNTANNSKNPEEEKNALVENPAPEESPDVTVTDDPIETTTTTSETKVRHDTVK
jgi:hypothetical protein